MFERGECCVSCSDNQWKCRVAVDETDDFHWIQKEQQAVSLVSEGPEKSPRSLCGRVLAGGDWWWSRVYGRDTVNLFFFSDGEIDEVLKCRWKKKQS